MLTLSEELFLLCMVEKRRSVAASKAASLPYALAGAMIYELISRGNIDLGKDKKLRVIDDRPAEDERLNEIIRKIQAADKPHKLAHWIARLGSKPKEIYSSVLLNLIIKGILREEKKRYLWVIPYRKYSEVGASAKFLSKQQLRSVVMGGEGINEQSAALLSLLRASGLVGQVFTKDEVKAAGGRISKIIQECAGETPRVKTLEDIAGAAASLAKRKN